MHANGLRNMGRKIKNICIMTEKEKKDRINILLKRKDKISKIKITYKDIIKIQHIMLQIEFEILGLEGGF